MEKTTLRLSKVTTDRSTIYNKNYVTERTVECNSNSVKIEVEDEIVINKLIETVNN